MGLELTINVAIINLGFISFIIIKKNKNKLFVKMFLKENTLCNQSSILNNDVKIFLKF